MVCLCLSQVDPSGSVEIDFVEPQEDFCIGTCLRGNCLRVKESTIFSFVLRLGAEGGAPPSVLSPDSERSEHSALSWSPSQALACTQCSQKLGASQVMRSFAFAGF